MLLQAQHPIAFTGAGMSAESGIPTFRNGADGLWKVYPVEQLATPSGYPRDKALVWGWYVWRMALVKSAAPNSGHRSLADMQRHWPDFTIVSQNVDDLHERAGSRSVLHLHGELFFHRCFECGERYEDFKLPLASANQAALRLEPPQCLNCGGSIRPGVTWFGEELPMEIWRKSKRTLEQTDVLLLVGTSGLVEPAASLVRHAKYCGARIIEINPEPTALTPLADLHLNVGAATALRELVEELGKRRSI